MQPIVMTLALVAAVLFFAWTFEHRWALLVQGHGDARFSAAGTLLWKRLEDVFVYAFGQRKMPRGKYLVAGLAHIAILNAFGVLLLNTIVLWGRGYDEHFDLFGILRRGTPLEEVYSLVKELSAAGAVVGSLVFVYYRVVRHEKRMTLSREGLVILGIIATMMLADFLYVGATLAMDAHTAGEAVRWHWPAPVGSAVALGLASRGEGTLRALQHVGFWWHSCWVLVFGNMLAYTKHFHIITAIPNVFTRSQAPRGQLPMVADIEGKIEREESIGLRTAHDLSWKDTLDLYTCTECGRCSDNCPAYTTDKKLSPKHLTLALRDHLYLADAKLVSGAPLAEGVDEEKRVEIHTTPPAPHGGYFQSAELVELVPNVVHPDVIWACTSCRACEEQCPVMISYVDKIVGLRREQVMVKNEFPAELMKPFNGMETNGNPWNLSRMSRGDWADGLDIPVVGEGAEFDVLYWVGCAASYDDRAKKIARATARLLTHAGVKFAILATEENCTGDPARRAGNEYLFQQLAQGNVETLNGYGLGKKPIVTACPHCFNTLLNEYPQLGGTYEVVHHTDFLHGLLARGALRPTRPVDAKIAYHDSCYLGRYNDVYASPREILAAIPGVELVEVPYWNKEKGLCCGAGGAQMFMEEQNENRVNKKRTLQLLDTGAKTIASGCPFCATMLGDGLKALDKEEDIAQLDVAELLERAIDFEANSGETRAAAAE